MNTQIVLKKEKMIEMKFQEQFFEAKPRFQKGEGYFLAPAWTPKQFEGKLHRNACRIGFPYFRKSESQGEMHTAEKRFVSLENERFHVKICLDWGGRMTSLWDKKLKRELLWTTPTIKNTNVGLNGAWTIGGIEWNCSRVGHCVHGHFNLGYDEVELENGLKGICFGATDELFETSWEITLVLDKAQVHCRMKVTNHSDEVQPLYWWSNIAAPAGRNIRLMYQPGPVLNHNMFYDPCYNEMQWPYFWGADASDWTQHHENISSYFHQYKSDFFGYIQKTERWAFYHRARHQVVKGRKLWSLGAYHVHPVWWARIAEPAWTPYVEIQSGLNPVQVDTESLMPKQVMEWTESFGAIQISDQADYLKAFESFETKASADFSLSLSVDESSYWNIKSKETKILPDLRAKISEEIVRNKKVSLESLDQVLQSGWVGGKSWIEYFKYIEKQGLLTDRRGLGYAACLIDQKNYKDATSILKSISKGRGLSSGLALYLLGLIDIANDKTSSAVNHLKEAVLQAPDLIFIYNTLDSLLEKNALLSDRVFLWSLAPECFQKTDEFRHTQAKIAFLKGKWSEVRQWMQEPFFSNGEGGFNPWKLYKESYIAEGLEAHLRGDVIKAQEMLSHAAQEMPQFFVGREEALLSADLFYYRWKIATMNGDESYARSLHSHAMNFKQQPYMPEALYLYRLAREVEDPTKETRLQEIQQWNQKAGEKTNQLYPIRSAIWDSCQENQNGWKNLQDDLLYCYRARWELGLIK